MAQTANSTTSLAPSPSPSLRKQPSAARISVATKPAPSPSQDSNEATLPIPPPPAEDSLLAPAEPSAAPSQPATEDAQIQLEALSKADLQTADVDGADKPTNPLDAPDTTAHGSDTPSSAIITNGTRKATATTKPKAKKRASAARRLARRRRRHGTESEGEEERESSSDQSSDDSSVANDSASESESESEEDDEEDEEDEGVDEGEEHAVPGAEKGSVSEPPAVQTAEHPSGEGWAAMTEQELGAPEKMPAAEALAPLSKRAKARAKAKAQASKASAEAQPASGAEGDAVPTVDFADFNAAEGDALEPGFPDAEHRDEDASEGAQTDSAGARSRGLHPTTRAALAYRERLQKDPTYTPRLGQFWGHDDRLLETDLRKLSGWWRGRGRGRGEFEGGSRGAGRGRGRGRGGAAGSQDPPFEDRQVQFPARNRGGREARRGNGRGRGAVKGGGRPRSGLLGWADGEDENDEAELSAPTPLESADKPARDPPPHAPRVENPTSSDVQASVPNSSNADARPAANKGPNGVVKDDAAASGSASSSAQVADAGFAANGKWAHDGFEALERAAAARREREAQAQAARGGRGRGRAGPGFWNGRGGWANFAPPSGPAGQSGRGRAGPVAPAAHMPGVPTGPAAGVRGRGDGRGRGGPSFGSVNPAQANPRADADALVAAVGADGVSPGSPKEVRVRLPSADATSGAREPASTSAATSDAQPSSEGLSASVSGLTERTGDLSLGGSSVTTAASVGTGQGKRASVSKQTSDGLQGQYDALQAAQRATDEETARVHTELRALAREEHAASSSSQGQTHASSPSVQLVAPSATRPVQSYGAPPHLPAHVLASYAHSPSPGPPLSPFGPPTPVGAPMLPPGFAVDTGGVVFDLSSGAQVGYYPVAMHPHHHHPMAQHEWWVPEGQQGYGYAPQAAQGLPNTPTRRPVSIRAPPAEDGSQSQSQSQSQPRGNGEQARGGKHARASSSIPARAARVPAFRPSGSGTASPAIAGGAAAAAAAAPAPVPAPAPLPAPVETGYDYNAAAAAAQRQMSGYATPVDGMYEGGGAVYYGYAMQPGYGAHMGGYLPEGVDGGAGGAVGGAGAGGRGSSNQSPTMTTNGSEQRGAHEQDRQGSNAPPQAYYNPYADPYGAAAAAAAAAGAYAAGTPPPSAGMYEMGYDHHMSLNHQRHQHQHHLQHQHQHQHEHQHQQHQLQPHGYAEYDWVHAHAHAQGGYGMAFAHSSGPPVGVEPQEQQEQQACEA